MEPPFVIASGILRCKEGWRLAIFKYICNIYGMSTARASTSDFLSLLEHFISLCESAFSMMTLKPLNTSSHLD